MNEIKSIKVLLIILFLILSISIFGFMLLKDQDYYADELPHSNQIYKFMRNDYSLITYLTVIPGYHLYISYIIKLLAVPVTLPMIRFVSLLTMIFLMVPLFYSFTNGNIIRTLQLYFWPSIHIFYFLVYTDILSAGFVLGSFFYATQKRYYLSGILIGISLLIRQNNFFWLGFIVLFFIFREWNVTMKNTLIKDLYFSTIFKTLFKKGMVYIIAGLSFVIFVALNGGIVLGVDKTSHPISFHMGNIWFILFSTFILLLPVILSEIPNMIKYIKKYPKMLIILFGIFLIGLGTGTNTHIYNQNSVFLKNKILIWAYSSPITSIIYMLIVVFVVWYLLTIKLNMKYAWLIYPITFFYLSLSWMIEFRYYTIPILFFLIFRPKVDKVVEIEQLIYQILISIVMFLGILNWKIFW